MLKVTGELVLKFCEVYSMKLCYIEFLTGLDIICKAKSQAMDFYAPDDSRKGI